MSGCTPRTPELGFAVALTLVFDSSVGDAALAGVRQVVVTASGDESYERTIALNRAPTRTERVVYRPLSTTRALRLDIVATGADQRVIASGSAMVPGLTPGKTSLVEIGLFAPQPLDLGAGDAASTPDGPGPTLLFEETFAGAALDTTAKWTAVGDGTWSIENGRGVQSNPDAVASLLYASAFTGATDYRVVARLRATGPFDAGLDTAPEISFRVAPSISTPSKIPQNYHCNFDLFQNVLLLQDTAANQTVFDQRPVPLPVGFDPSTPFVLEATVNQNAVTCTLTIDNVPGTVTVVTGAATQLVGSFGLKTYQTKIEVEYFRVYAL